MTKRKNGIIALLILSVVWSSFGIPIRYLSPHFSLFQQLYLRIFLGAVLAGIFFYKDLRFKRFLHIPKRDILLLLFRVIIMYGFAVTLYTQAFTLTTFSSVSFLGAIPTTAVLGFILLREKITWHKVGLILLSVVGIFLITVKNPTHFFSWGRGDILALTADFFFSLTYITRKWHSNFFNNKELAFLMLLLGSSFLFLLSMLSGQGIPVIEKFTLETSIVIFIAGVLNIASMYLMNYGFAYVEAALASNIVSLESFWAVILGFLFYREIPSLHGLFGGILIIASVVLLNKEEEQEKKK